MKCILCQLRTFLHSKKIFVSSETDQNSFSRSTLKPLISEFFAIRKFLKGSEPSKTCFRVDLGNQDKFPSVQKHFSGRLPTQIERYGPYMAVISDTEIRPYHNEVTVGIVRSGKARKTF